MKSFSILCIFLSIICVKATNDDLKNKISKKGILVNFSSNNLRETQEKSCDFCYENYEELHEAFQILLEKEFFLAWYKQLCPDQKCYKRIEIFVESVAKEKNVKKACEIVCDKEKQELALRNRFSNLINLMNSWNQVSCYDCRNSHRFLHKAFQSVAYKEYYIFESKKLCPNKYCIEKLKALTELIAIEKNVNKACKPVCS